VVDRQRRKRGHADGGTWQTKGQKEIVKSIVKEAREIVCRGRGSSGKGGRRQKLVCNDSGRKVITPRKGGGNFGVNPELIDESKGVNRRASESGS